jgi:hypothetical protein
MARPWPFEPSARIAVEGQTAKGVNWANVFWVLTGSGTTPTPANCTALATSVYNSYHTRLFAHLGKDAHMTRCVVNWYGPQPTQVTGDYLATTAGGSTNNTEVDSLSMALSWRFAATWRGGKPRTYLPALPTEAFHDSNTLDSTFMATMLTGASNFLSDAPTWDVSGVFPSVQLGVMSFFSHNAPRTVGAFYPFTGVVIHPRIDSMRRRLGREIV